ncbi:MAG: hypothetical protein P4N24_15695 [Acidobacteriota bacterium]|nr:hypothetical protein [Acidobacteriota bacterium]
MESPELMQPQVTPPSVLKLAVMSTDRQFDTNGIQTLQPASPAETSGLSPQVFPQPATGRPSPKGCTTDQLFEIVIEVARRFRTAKADVAEHKGYILRLKNDVFKVSFGSVGVHVPVTYKTEDGVPATKKMRWNEFCETQFCVSADWINRICGGKAEGRVASQAAKPESEKVLYKHGYQAAKAELQAPLKAAAEMQATLEGRLAELETENKKLHGTTGGRQQHGQVSGGKVVAKLEAQVEGLKEFADLATEAFEIINGDFGSRLMGNVDGNRLVAIAKKALAMKGKLKVC